MIEFLLSFNEGLKSFFSANSVAMLFVLAGLYFVIDFRKVRAAHATILCGMICSAVMPFGSVSGAAVVRILSFQDVLQNAGMIIFYMSGVTTICAVWFLLLKGIKLKMDMSGNYSLLAAACAMIIAGLITAVAYASGTSEKDVFESDAARLHNPLLASYPAPEIQGIESWINATTPPTLQSLRGQVVLVYFWTYACYNCVNTLPYLKKWEAAYQGQGLQIIGIHTPEFDFEYKRDKVMSAVQRYDIRFPVALDNRFETWKAYQNKYWPAMYLVNKQGQVVYTHFGEGRYAETENNIRYLLKS